MKKGLMERATEGVDLFHGQRAVRFRGVDVSGPTYLVKIDLKARTVFFLSYQVCPFH